MNKVELAQMLERSFQRVGSTETNGYYEERLIVNPQCLQELLANIIEAIPDEEEK